MNGFIPDKKEAQAVPYFDDVDSSEGWQGHATSKSVTTLKAEIVKSITRLGGVVSGFQSGQFMIDDKRRDGFQIHYAIGQPGQGMLPGRLDVAALPVRKTYRHGQEAKRREQSLRMALYMTRNAIDGLWFLQMLSPGYAPLMPWMLARGDKTISQLWSETSTMALLLPPGDSEFVEGEIVG